MAGEVARLMERGRVWFETGRAALGSVWDHPVCRTVFRQLHRRRRTVAVTGSVLLHVLVLLSLLLPTTWKGGMSAGGGVGDGMGVGEGIELTLYDIGEARKAPEVKPSDPADLEALTQLDVAEVSDARLTEVVEASFSDLPSLVITESAATAQPSAAATAANQGATGTGGLTKGDGDDLWAAIAPCWRRVVDEHTVPVTLEVTFSAGGGLAAPPVIMRGDASASDAKQLVSESKAIQALAECGAYPMAGGQDHVSINFPALQ